MLKAARESIAEIYGNVKGKGGCGDETKKLVRLLKNSFYEKYIPRGIGGILLRNINNSAREGKFTVDFWQTVWYSILCRKGGASFR